MDCMRDLIPTHTKRYVITNALKSGVLNPPANKEEKNRMVGRMEIEW